MQNVHPHFYSCDVGCAILGANFLWNFGLIVDQCVWCLRDQETLLEASGVVKAGISLHPTVAQASEEGIVSKLIKEFPSIRIHFLIRKHCHIPPPII